VGFTLKACRTHPALYPEAHTEPRSIALVE
jgi:hypothetical protein